MKHENSYFWQKNYLVLPEQNFHLVYKPQHEWQVMHNQFAAENCTQLAAAAAADGDAQYSDCCSMAVDVVVAAADERRVGFAAVLHSVTQVGVVRALGD
jgi:hypothetical protein